jgi:hypothetical protein
MFGSYQRNDLCFSGCLQATSQLKTHPLRGLFDGRFVFDMAHDIDIRKIGQKKTNPWIFQLLQDGIGNSGSVLPLAPREDCRR